MEVILKCYAKGKESLQNDQKLPFHFTIHVTHSTSTSDILIKKGF